ncbi:hypothetical protein EUGRSUZ_H01776 [Eucalyptus grandis]|uniref:Uncharacterized protein n=2 Tax=Eucalyptus grandis TaxID=71139 RepID=A0ACC3JQM5_EUCGR|nr:hypothetical protein EUGRSUZ_H01776 [Eucalyptus grandis]
MASSSSNSRTSFKVFVSFREENVGNNFVTHLYAALVHAGIYYFDIQRREKDEGNLIITVPKMIEESDLAIIIFSEDNAYSRLCLEEVVKIMECKKQRDLKVFPVFYRVELGRVSGLKGSYRTGTEYFEKKLDKDVWKLMRWKDALQEAGSLSRWYLDDELSVVNIKDST